MGLQDERCQAYGTWMTATEIQIVHHIDVSG